MRLRTTLLALALMLACGGMALAAGAGPFGVGLPESGGSLFGSGPFGRAMMWIAAQQAAFYRGLVGTLQALKESGSALPMLVGLSFLYGVFHAAGPGHGKVVLSSYLLANEATLKRGVVLAFAASIVQATVAVALVFGLVLVLRATSFRLTETARVLELLSYLAMTLLGAGLLWSKLKPFRRPARSVGAAAVAGHGPDCLCCGGSHMPHPRAVQGSTRAAMAAVLAIGVRPCTGGLIVLAFALQQGMEMAGVMSVYVMGVGTAITVSALAAIAVYAKRSALRLAGRQSNRWLEVGGSALVFGLGLMLLLGALAAR